MLRCIVIDDEPWGVDLLVSYIGKVDFLSLSLATTSPMEALGFMVGNPVDLVFLDINMPEMTGLQFMEIMDQKVRVIISSAYPEYAVKGYDHNVVDYLLKPIEFERFLKGALKAKEAADRSFLINADRSQRDFLFIKTDGKLVRVDYEEILYIEGKRDYIAITTAKEKLISLDSLANMEAVLPGDHFIRIHKSFIIAINKIEYIEGRRVCINKEYLPIGESFKNGLLRSIKTDSRK